MQRWFLARVILQTQLLIQWGIWPKAYQSYTLDRGQGGLEKRLWGSEIVRRLLIVMYKECWMPPWIILMDHSIFNPRLYLSIEGKHRIVISLTSRIDFSDKSMILPSSFMLTFFLGLMLMLGQVRGLHTRVVSNYNLSMEKK